MFRGNCPTRLDDKGRLKIPADFKHEIDRNYDSEFYITSRDKKVVDLYPLKEWEQIEERIAKLPSSNAAVQKFLNITSYFGQVVSMDPQGRLTIGDRLRAQFGLKGEVAVVGKLNHIEIRPMDEFKEYIDTNSISDEENDQLAQLGI
ncbi:MAG: division/cell wall cluster transcriptional repressor MraZ [Acidobacteriota bacterium]|nr:division/cell wall cluster transcriptional repressor MraZ [Acidobacteriota bacterium]